MNLVALQCPNCGAAITPPVQASTVRCSFCAHVFMVAGSEVAPGKSLQGPSTTGSAEEDEATSQAAQRLMAEIEMLSPQVEQATASSTFGKEALGKMHAVMQNARDAISRGDMSALKNEHLALLDRTARLCRGLAKKA